MRILLPLHFAIHWLTVPAQDWTAVDKTELLGRLDASAAKFSSYTHYELRSELLAYTNSTDAQPAERGTSTVWCMGKSAKAEHLGALSYQNERMSVTIDQEDHLIMVAEPVDFFGHLPQTYRQEVFGKAIGIGRAVRDAQTVYRASFGKGSDFDVIEFAFDAQGWLRRIEVHWGVPIALVPDRPLSARVTPKVVLLVGVPTRIAAGSVNTDPAQAVATERGILVPAKRYADYTLIDNRLNP